MKDQLIQQIVSVVNDGAYSFIILGWNGKLYEAIQYQIQDLLTQAIATQKANEFQSVELGVEYARKTKIEVGVKTWVENLKSSPSLTNCLRTKLTPPASPTS